MHACWQLLLHMLPRQCKYASISVYHRLMNIICIHPFIHLSILYDHPFTRWKEGPRAEREEGQTDSIHPSIHIHASNHVFMHASICPSIYSTNHLPIYLSIHLSIHSCSCISMYIEGFRHFISIDAAGFSWWWSDSSQSLCIHHLSSSHHQASKAGEDDVGATVFSKLSMEGAGHEEPDDGGRAATGILVSEPRARDIRWVAAAAVMSKTLTSMLLQCVKPSHLCCCNV